MLGTVMATCSILQSVMKYANPAVSIYPVVKNNWQPTPATNRFLGPTISRAERSTRYGLRSTRSACRLIRCKLKKKRKEKEKRAVSELSSVTYDVSYQEHPTGG